MDRCRSQSNAALVALLATVVVFCCTVFTRGAAAEQWKLVFEDEFNIDGPIDTEKWNFELGFIRNAELQWYTNSTANLFVRDGALHIIGRKEDIPVPEQPDGQRVAHYTSASVFAKPTFQYGRFDFRAMVPARGNGSWPALWMLGADIDAVGWPWCGEIDVMEAVGFMPDVVHGTFHNEAANSMRNNQVTATVYIDNMSTSFHNYSVVWTPQEITIYEDGHAYCWYANDGRCTPISWPYFKPFVIKMNLAIGGSWGGMHGVDNSIFPLSFVIDYVRVYQQVDHLPHSRSGGPGCAQFHHYIQLNYDSLKVSATVVRAAVAGNGTLLQVIGMQLVKGLASQLRLSSDALMMIHAISIRPKFDALLVNFSLVDMPPSAQLEAEFRGAEANAGLWLAPVFAVLAEAVTSDRGAWSLSWISSTCHSCFLPEIDDTSVNSSVPVPLPWGENSTIPGNVVATKYDVGGQNVAYSDVTAWNQYGQFGRAGPDWVDIGVASGSGGSVPFVGFIESGEWLRFSGLECAEPGAYEVSVLAANANAHATGRVLLHVAPMPNRGNSSSGAAVYVPPDGANSSALDHWINISVPSTGSSWEHPARFAASAPLNLSNGTYTLTLYFPEASFTIFNVTFEGPVTPPSPDKRRHHLSPAATYALIAALAAMVGASAFIIMRCQRDKSPEEYTQIS